jgi:prolipoprotein diacylglyceryltransferase
MQPFSILLGLGTLTGLLLIVWRAPKKEINRHLDAGLWTLLGALIGSRVMEVIINFTYYQSHPSEMIQVWQGGLSGIGAILGGLTAIIILSVLWKLPIGKLADMVLPLAGTLTITTWLGCWMDSCGYGLPLKMWWALPGRDEWGTMAQRVPVQLIGAILTLMLLLLLDWASKRLSIPGLKAAIGVFGISAVILGLSFVRADPAPSWNGLRLEAWGAIGLMIFCVIAVVVLLLRWILRRKQYPQE